MTELFHIVDEEDWNAAVAAGTYAPRSLASEGFIHLSTAAQVPGTLERFYAGVADLLLLTLDADVLGDALRWDEVLHPDGSTGTFPHLYRALKPGEVVTIRPAR